MMNYIERILNSTWYPDICKSNADYKILAKLLHPDVTNNKEAIAAFSHLNQLKDYYEKGYLFKDESGEYRSNYLNHKWIGDNTLLQKSRLNYHKLINYAEDQFDSSSFSHFRRYLPSNLDFEGDVLVYNSRKKCIPLSKVIELLPQQDKNKHVNWIYSRLIEFVSMLESLGLTHTGLNPDSIFVVPEDHAIKVVSFYHLCVDRVKTINGKYKNYYPQFVFDTKEAGSYIDLSTIKKTAICALGDVSGSGTRLRSDKGVNQNVLNYLLTSESDAFESMQIWRNILDINFIKEFIELNI